MMMKVQAAPTTTKTMNPNSSQSSGVGSLHLILSRFQSLSVSPAIRFCRDVSFPARVPQQEPFQAKRPVSQQTIYPRTQADDLWQTLRRSRHTERFPSPGNRRPPFLGFDPSLLPLLSS